MIPAALDIIKRYEGFSTKPYLCPAGKWTIGYGETHNITPNTPHISQEGAESMLIEHLRNIEASIWPLIAKTLNNNQMAALLSFVYNLGLENFKSSTLLELINSGKFAEAADQFLRWDKYKNHKTGKKESLLGLTKRRTEERALFLKEA